MYGGALSSVTIWGFGISDLAAIVSAVVAIAGLLVHVHFTIKKHAMDKEIHLELLKEMKLRSARLTGEKGILENAPTKSEPS